MPFQFVLSAIAVLAAPAAYAAKPAYLHGATMHHDRADGRFCLKDKEPQTGSRLRRIECRTAAEWQEEGLTVSLRKIARQQDARASKPSSQPVSMVGPAGLEPAT